MENAQPLPNNVLQQYLQNFNTIGAEQFYMNVDMARQSLLAEERYQQPKRLQKHGFKTYAQNDEDGIIAEIVNRIGKDKVPQTFVEFGIEAGVQCNTMRLLADGWKGLWMEGSEAYCNSIKKSHSSYILGGRLKLKHSFITKDNINTLIEEAGYGNELGLISIDIDGNDIWIWQALRVKPAIVVMEYNPTWHPPLSVAVPYKEDFVWNGSNYHGSSLEAQTKIAKEKGYNLVGCSLAGVNAFFVREDLCGSKFHSPYTAQEHYEPCRYWLRFLKSGHPGQIGELLNI